VNCAECQTDPLTPGHYCPCCGRKLSLEEQRALGPRLPAGAAVPATVIAVASSRDLTPVAAQKASAVDTTRGVTLSPPIVDVDEIRMAKAKAVADQTAQAHLAKAANPAPAIRRPIVPVPPPPRRQSYAPKLMIAAAVIVGAIGAAEGARRLGFDWTGQDVREAPPAQVTPSASNVVPAKAPSPAAAQPKAGAIGKRASVRPANPPVQQSAPVVARTPSPEIPASAQGMPQAAESARPPAPITGRGQSSARRRQKNRGGSCACFADRPSAPCHAASWVDARSRIGRGCRCGGGAVDLLACKETRRASELLVQLRHSARPS
jgi:hypothetical protein